MLRSHSLTEEGTLRVQATKPPTRFEVACDGTGIAGHAGAALLVSRPTGWG